jgi:two-component system sensor histidine kinase ResE
MAKAGTYESTPPVHKRWYQRLPALPVGLRLSLAFQVIIVLTGLIGFLTVQRLNLLIDTTTELNTHDLPEVILFSDLRLLLLEQRDAERDLVSEGLSDRQRQERSAFLTDTLKRIASQHRKLMVLEAITPDRFESNDALPIQRLSGELARNDALAHQVQTLANKAQFVQARALERQHEPLIQSSLTTVGVLMGLAQQEADSAAVWIQEESHRATQQILILTALALLISVALAIIFTRSLTRPIATLLSATETIASGDLDVPLQLVRRDEIGRLAATFDHMRLNLRSTIETLALERRQTQAVIDASLDGVLLVDAERTILQCNPAAVRLSGGSPDAVVGRHCWEVFGCRGILPEEAEAHERLCPLNTVLHMNAPSASIEMQIAPPHGQQRWLALSCASTPLHGGAAEQRLVVNMHDITQLKAVEQAKTDFVAMVSHELRAPLTTVAGSVEMLGLLDPAHERKAFDEVVDILHQQTLRLRQVVEEVLQLTRLEAGRLQARLRPLLLTPFLHTLITHIRLEHAADAREILLEVADEQIQVWADPELLELVLRNLLDNAYKYTPEGSLIEISGEAAERDGRVTLHVHDHGPGIPPEQHARIFDRFTRATQATQDWTRGYGLGLSIARELLHLHNGEIWIEPCTEGACFAFSLWVVKDDPPEQVGKKALESDDNNNSDG